MSGNRSIDLEAIIELTETLTGLLADQARSFEQHRPQEAAASLPEVTRLATLYRESSARVRAEPSLVVAAPPAIRQRLLRATEGFEAVLERHGRAVAASKTITEGLVKAIADEIAAKRAQTQAYGPAGVRKPAAVAITLDRQA